VKRRRAAEKWIADRSTVRRIKDRTKTKDHTKHWRNAQKYSKHIPSPLENLKQNLSKVSGILLLDATYVKVLGEGRFIHTPYDTGIGIVDYWIDCTENKQAYGYVLRRLSDVGYKPLCVVSDGHWAIESLLEEESIPQQRCLFHILRDLSDFLSIRGELVGANHILYSRLKYILKSNTLEKLVERCDWFRQHSQPQFNTGTHMQVLKWFWNILPNAVIWLSFEDVTVPRTTSALDVVHGQIKARIKTFRGVKSEESLQNLLKILFRFRNYK
jgi:transposase-like protein